MIKITTIYEPRPIRIDEVRMSIRGAGASDKPAYETACNFIWETPTSLTISMLNGETPRVLLRELLEKLDELGVKTVHASRAEGRLMPRLFQKTGHRADDMYTMDVATAMSYLNRPSQFADLGPPEL